MHIASNTFIVKTLWKFLTGHLTLKFNILKNNHLTEAKI